MREVNGKVRLYEIHFFHFPSVFFGPKFLFHFGPYMYLHISSRQFVAYCRLCQPFTIGLNCLGRVGERISKPLGMFFLGHMLHFPLKTEFQSNSGQFCDIECLRRDPVFIGQLHDSGHDSVVMEIIGSYRSAFKEQ